MTLIDIIGWFVCEMSSDQYDNKFSEDFCIIRNLFTLVNVQLHLPYITPFLYCIPVSANINDKDLHKLEDVQLNSIKRIIGVKAHSSSAAVEVVSGICPVGIRKRDLCCREYIRISSGESHSLVQLLKCTKRVGLRFCPLEYLRVMSRETERKLKGFKLERFQTVKAECFGRSNNILQMDLQDVIINAVELNKVKKYKYE